MNRYRHFLAVSALFLVLVSAQSGLAFHEQGVARCNGCHTMHVSQNGGPMYHWNPEGNEHLLMYGNASDTCLMCHSWYNGNGYSPGGDFYWISKTFTWEQRGTVVESRGDSHGHNVVSGFRHVDADALNATAPGGTFDSRYLGCTSCHDPHGNTNFRMLYGDGDAAYYDGAGFAFSAPAPIAVGNSGYAVTPGSEGAETNTSHTIYKSGMSEWCANCHEDFHTASTTDFVHPSGEPLGGAVSAAYNAYVSSVDPLSGDRATSYLGLVPFEAVDIDPDLVDPRNHTEGPGAQDQVMCLSCHRAHASPFGDAGRWDFSATFLEDSHPQLTDGGATAADVANRYYGYTFVPEQRSLCNKCHLKDLGDRTPGDSTEWNRPSPPRRRPIPVPHS